MDVRQLETLRVVADRGGVIAASRVLSCTPSAVSQQLKALTRSAGVPLTERHGRGLRLTPAGHALVAAAEDVAVALVRAEEAAAQFLGLPTGTVRVAAFQSGAQMLLPDLLTWARGRDGLTVECSDEDVAQADFVDLTADFDVVIAHRPDGEGSGWQGRGVRVVPLLREPLDVAVPEGHRLAGRGTVTPADLVDEDWIAVREGFPVAAVLDEVGLRSGRPPRIVQRINDFHVVEALVAAGHGISLLPRYTTGRRAGSGLRMVRLDEVRAGRQIDALVRRDRGERLVVQQVLDELRAVARRIEDAPAG